MANNIDNQTAFQEKAPIFEQPLMGTVAKEVSQAQQADKKVPFYKTSKGMLLIFASALLIVILVLLSLLVSLKRTVQPIIEENQKNDGQTTSVEKTEFEQQLDDLKLNLQEADPLNQDIPYPPVDKNLTLDDLEED